MWGLGGARITTIMTMIHDDHGMVICIHDHKQSWIYIYTDHLYVYLLSATRDIWIAIVPSAALVRAVVTRFILATLLTCVTLVTLLISTILLLVSPLSLLSSLSLSWALSSYPLSLRSRHPTHLCHHRTCHPSHSCYHSPCHVLCYAVYHAIYQTISHALWQLLGLTYL